MIRVHEQLDNSAAMAKALVEAGAALHEIYIHNVSLEDYFLGVTGGENNG